MHCHLRPPFAPTVRRFNYLLIMQQPTTLIILQPQRTHDVPIGTKFEQQCDVELFTIQQFHRSQRGNRVDRTIHRV